MLGLLGGLLVSAPLALYVLESNKAVDAAEKELEGLSPIATLAQATQHVQLHRDLSAMVLGGVDDRSAPLAAKSQEVTKVFAEIDLLFADRELDKQAGATWKRAKAIWRT